MAAAPASGKARASAREEREEVARRTLRADLEKLRLLAASAAQDAERLLAETVETTPYLATAAAAGIGFLLGGGLPRGAVTLLLGAGARLVTAWIGQEILQRAAPGSSDSEQEEMQ